MGFNTIINHRVLGNGSVGGVAIALKSLIEDDTQVYVVDNQSFSPPEDPVFEEKLEGGKGSQIKVRVPEWAMKANYEGLANGVLWPANHDMVDLIESEDSIRLLKSVGGNNRVTSRIRAELSRSLQNENAKVLVNDYQITGVGKGVYFHHTPFFSPDTYDAAGGLTNGNLIQGILKTHIKQLTRYDAVGVQTPRDLENLGVLINYLFEDARVSKDGDVLRVKYGDNVTLMKAVPIGTDPYFIEESVQNSSQVLDYVLKNGKSFRSMLEEDRRNGRYVISRVGRADYTKAYPENMDFIHHFAQRFADDPGDPRRFRAYVIAAETRPNVPAYYAEMQKIRSKAENVNAQWREKGHEYDLIELVTQEVPQETCLALMKNSDVYVDVSEKDGMHLTPQESIIANGPGRGFVICGINSGTGYLLKRAGFDGGTHGLLVVEKSSRAAAEATFALYRKGHRISEDLFEHVKRNNVYEWSRNLEKLADMKR